MPFELFFFIIKIEWIWSSFHVSSEADICIQRLFKKYRFQSGTDWSADYDIN